MPQMSRAELKRWAMPYLHPDWWERNLEPRLIERGTRYAKDPTTSIAEAFALTALLKTEDQKAAFGFELMRLVLDGEWPEENIPDFEAFEIAMASPEQRCQAVYWAVEGERVEIREEL